MIGYFIAVNRKTGHILTGGQSIYRWRDSAKRGISQWVNAAERDDYDIVEITGADILRLASSIDYGALVTAAHEFIAKVDSGAARSVRTYAAFKSALGLVSSE